MEKRFKDAQRSSSVFPRCLSAQSSRHRWHTRVLSLQQHSAPSVLHSPPHTKFGFPLPIRTLSTRFQGAAERQFIKYAQFPKSNLSGHAATATKHICTARGKDKSLVMGKGRMIGWGGEGLVRAYHFLGLISVLTSVCVCVCLHEVCVWTGFQPLVKVCQPPLAH